MSEFWLFILCMGLIYALYKIVMKKQTLEKLKQRYPQFFAQPIDVPNIRMVYVQHDHTLQDERLFDAVATSFFEYQFPTWDYEEALKIQTEILSRMPQGTHTEVRHLILDEWSIYWSFNQLSLEFYVGQYGIFYAHVDQFGQEHRLEYHRPEMVLSDQVLSS